MLQKFKVYSGSYGILAYLA